MRTLALASVILLACLPAYGAQEAACAGTDKACLFDMLEETTMAVGEQQWQDQTWREMAKLLAHDGQADRAIPLISRIKNPDTKAMTIRGIGIAAAENKLNREDYDRLFAQLTAEAGKIDHAPSKAIALTYIAIGQSMSGDNEAALKTAASMENAAQRRKAYGELGETQAARNDLKAAIASVGAIDDAGFRDKEYKEVSKIFANGRNYDSALEAARMIGNSYQKAEAILYILVRQVTPEEVSIQ